MATVALEGVGAQIVFATSGFASDLISLTLPERAREAIDTTHLGSTTVKTSKPSKLFDPGQVQAEFDHDPDASRLIGADPETITVKYPLLTGEVTPAQLEFTGYVVSEGGEEFTVGARMTTKLTIQVTSDYTYTAAT